MEAHGVTAPEHVQPTPLDDDVLARQINGLMGGQLPDLGLKVRADAGKAFQTMQLIGTVQCRIDRARLRW